MTSEVPMLDERLWFEMAGCPGRHFFVDGNSTILGRIYAWCPTKQITTRVSKSEVVAASDESWYFIKGFLAGSEPAPPLDEEGMLSTDEAAVARWRSNCAEWRVTGEWPRSDPA
jgi:hypothetical protein